MSHSPPGSSRPRVGDGRATDAPGVSDETLVSRTVHELASPLTVVGGFAETLLRHHNEMTPHQRDRYLGAIQRHTERLSRIVSDLGQLQQARTGRSETRVRAVPIEGVVHDALQIAASAAGRPASGTLAEIAERLEVELVVEEDATAEVDETHLVRMLVNLVENSLKYGEGPRRLTVATTRAQVALWLADSGDGIPASMRDRIFDPYERGDHQRLAGVSGSGLGLSIVAELAHLNGGSVRLVETTRGSCFELVLPAAQVTAATA